MIDVLSNCLLLLLGAAISFLSFRYAHRSNEGILKELLSQLRAQNRVIAAGDLQVYAGMNQVDNQVTPEIPRQAEPEVSLEEAQRREQGRGQRTGNPQDSEQGRVAQLQERAVLRSARARRVVERAHCWVCVALAGRQRPHHLDRLPGGD